VPRVLLLARRRNVRAVRITVVLVGSSVLEACGLHLEATPPPPPPHSSGTPPVKEEKCSHLLFISYLIRLKQPIGILWFRFTTSRPPFSSCRLLAALYLKLEACILKLLLHHLPPAYRQAGSFFGYSSCQGGEMFAFIVYFLSNKIKTTYWEFVV